MINQLQNQTILMLVILCNTDKSIMTKYNTDKPELGRKIPDVSNLVNKTKLTELENKIPDISNLVKKTDYNTKISDIENKLNNHNHDKYIYIYIFFFSSF